MTAYSGYNGQDATVLITPSRPIHAADRSRYAMPDSYPISLAAQQRFWQHVGTDTYDPDECWPWKGRLQKDGYGRFNIGKTPRFAHRIAWLLLRGAIPTGLQLDHLCRNRCCCNPCHLEPVTQKENILRGNGFAAKNARKTHCPRGHELSGANLYPWPTRPGTRLCYICEKQRRRKPIKTGTEAT